MKVEPGPILPQLDHTPLNFLLFSQVLEILTSLIAYSDRGRQLVETVLNQIAGIWLVVQEELYKTQADASDGDSDGDRQLPQTSKDKMWGFLNYYLSLDEHSVISGGTALSMPLEAKEKLMQLLNTLVIASRGPVNRGSARAQVCDGIFASSVCFVSMYTVQIAT